MQDTPDRKGSVMFQLNRRFLVLAGATSTLIALLLNFFSSKIVAASALNSRTVAQSLPPTTEH
ncbi:MAG: hypothetical protein VKJ46_15120, partial [Leptolyngbyaceae bacterium]|nr:hypothetical protein [Leptolyngbyaceae bacterium]